MENIIKEQLREKGYELLDYTKGTDGSLNVSANKLHPVILKDGQQYLVPIPVNLHVWVDSENHVTNVKSDQNEDVLKTDAEHFAKSLSENNEISGSGEDGSLTSTHKLEFNEDGKPIIRRKGFSMF